ncbi:MAG: hypothetical protein J7L89_08740 [Bacteroidales bacterium]|nr:hypothetical protein [Bacteroidales bacterium]
MNRLVTLAVLAVMCISCEDTPDICMEVKPSPVLYMVVDKFDSLNYLIVTKTFSGDGGGSIVNAKKWDSIYYSGVEAECSFDRIVFGDTSGSVVETKRIIAIESVENDKNPGFF